MMRHKLFRFFFSSRRRHTRCYRDWSSDVCSSDLVSISRRAYRSGENEYFLNRDRVRLRDISDIFGQVGLDLDGFAVVGQGAVDSALSQRPGDRRALVEQAAGIGYLQSRLSESQSRLDQTHQNLERVTDLLAELTPRLRVLERQARL